MLKILFFENISINIVVITPQGGLDMSNGLRAHHGFAINLAIKFIVRNVVRGEVVTEKCVMWNLTWDLTWNLTSSVTLWRSIWAGKLRWWAWCEILKVENLTWGDHGNSSFTSQKWPWLLIQFTYVWCTWCRYDCERRIDLFHWSLCSRLLASFLYRMLSGISC